MALSKSAQRRIMQQDAIRRLERESATIAAVVEIESYSNKRGAHANVELVRGVGVVTPPGQVRVSRAYASARAGKGRWSDVTVRDTRKPTTLLRQISCAATAYDDNGKAVYIDGRPTVKVTKGDTIEYVPISTKRQPGSKPSTGPRTAVEREHHMTCADLAPIGNIV